MAPVSLTVRNDLLKIATNALLMLEIEQNAPGSIDGLAVTHLRIAMNDIVTHATDWRV